MFISMPSECLGVMKNQRLQIETVLMPISSHGSFFAILPQADLKTLRFCIRKQRGQPGNRWNISESLIN